MRGKGTGQDRSAGRRDISGAPPLLDDILIVVVIIAFGVLVAWAAPDIHAWIRGLGPVPAPTSDGQRCPEHQARAEKFGALVAAALNGKSLTDGERTVACRVVR